MINRQTYFLRVCSTFSILTPLFLPSSSVYTLSGSTGSALVSGIPKVAGSHLTQCSKSRDLLPSPHCSVHAWSSGGTALCRVGGATSQLDLPSLTPLSVAGCG